MKQTLRNKRIIKCFVLVVIAIVSFFVLSSIFSSPNTYGSYIEILDQKRNNVLNLTAASTTLSAAITMAPSDIGNPIAEKLVDLSSYFIVILTAIYLEKYLLTTLGYVVFKVLIPVCCLGVVASTVFDYEVLKKIFIKVSIFSLAIFLVIPASITISNVIENTYQTDIVTTVSVDEELEEETETEEPKTDKKWYEEIADTFVEFAEEVKETAEATTSEVYEEMKSALNNFIEAIAVMIITSCIIPLLTLMVFVWLSKLILGLTIEQPSVRSIKNIVREELGGK